MQAGQAVLQLLIQLSSKMHGLLRMVTVSEALSPADLQLSVQGQTSASKLSAWQLCVRLPEARAVRRASVAERVGDGRSLRHGYVHEGMLGRIGVVATPYLALLNKGAQSPSSFPLFMHFNAGTVHWQGFAAGATFDDFRDLLTHHMLECLGERCDVPHCAECAARPPVKVVASFTPSPHTTHAGRPHRPARSSRRGRAPSDCDPAPGRAAAALLTWANHSTRSV